MNVKVIVFDLDDTLYDEIEFVKSGFFAVARYFMPTEPQKLYNTMLDILDKKGRGYVFDEALQTFALYSKANVKKALNIYRTHTPNIQLNKDAKEILEYYKRQNTPLYIVTDGNKVVQANKFFALRLEKWIKKPFITHRYGIIHAKPSPYCFLKIALLENVNYEDIVYIADNINKDFVDIKALGFRTIQIKQGMFKNTQKPQKYEAELRIQSLLELQKILTL
ncbi:MAG: HAD family hydrolase [Campylobacterales bacterium]|nr:HAD family hydrolase [Campylobacterales bacterium]